MRQDQQGFLWIGTSNGLCRFDGSHFYTFPSGLFNSNKLVGDLILDLEEDGEYIWVAHRFGLSRINKNTFLCENFNSPDSGSIYSLDRAIRDIYLDDDRTIWLSGDRELLRFDKKSNSIKLVWDLVKERPKGASVQVSKIVGGGKDHILLYLVNGWAGYDIKRNVLDSQLSQSIPAASLKGDNLRLRSYWNTFPSNFYVSYDTKKGKINISTTESAEAISQVKNIYIDSNLTMYTNSEKNQFAAWSKENRIIRSNNPGNGADNFFLKEFNFGSRIYGVQCWGRADGLFISDKSLTYSKKYFFSEKALKTLSKKYEINDVKVFDENNWLVGTGSSLLLMNRFTHKLHPFSQWKDSLIYTMVVLPDQSIWLSTEKYIYHFNPSSGRILKRIFTRSYANVLHYFDNRLLAATRSNGILLLDIKDYSFIKIQETDLARQITSNRITSVKPTGEIGNFIITYNKAGHYSLNNFITGKYKPDSIPVTPSVFNENFPVTTAESGSQQLWLGQYIGGVMLYDSIKGTWMNLTKETGLRSNYINEILSDRHGKTWIVTDEGIEIYEESKGTVSRFPASLESGGRTGGFITSIGTLVFFDKAKIIEVNPEVFSLQSEQKKILFGQVMQGKTQLHFKENTLKLPYNKNSLSIIFSLQQLEPGRKTDYGYRLRNNENWTDIGQETELSFASLQPGKYDLQLRATDEFGQWSYHSEVLTIIISPPFWKTWWFYLLAALFISAVLWMVYRYRINQLKKVLTMRTKISQDLHDEVGATLSGVTLMSELANEKLKTHKTEETRSIISRITTESKEMAEKMNDIVWAINPVNDSIEKVLNKIQRYGVNLCSSRNIHFHFIRPDDREEVHLNMQVRNNIYLVCKEAINNAVKYSGAKNINFSLSGKKNNYLLMISDDGTGFDIAAIYQGNGLVNMKARAKEISGMLTIRSGSEKGTQIELSF